MALYIVIAVIAVLVAAIVAVCVVSRRVREAIGKYLEAVLQGAVTKQAARNSGQAEVLREKAGARAAHHRARAAVSNAKATTATASAAEIRAIIAKSAKTIGSDLAQTLAETTKHRDNAAAWLSRSLAAFIDVVRGLLVASAVLGGVFAVCFGFYSLDKANTNPHSAVVLVCRAFAVVDGDTSVGRIYTSSGTFSVNPGVYGGVHYRTSVGALKAFPAHSWAGIVYHGYTGPTSDPFDRWITVRRLLPRRAGVCR